MTGTWKGRYLSYDETQARSHRESYSGLPGGWSFHSEGHTTAKIYSHSHSLLQRTKFTTAFNFALRPKSKEHKLPQYGALIAASNCGMKDLTKVSTQWPDFENHALLSPHYRPGALANRLSVRKVKIMGEINNRCKIDRCICTILHMLIFSLEQSWFLKVQPRACSVISSEMSLSTTTGQRSSCVALHETTN